MNQMPERLFHGLIIAISIGFVAYFSVFVLPPLLESGDMSGALAAGFVNPYSSSYSADLIGSWLVFGAWVFYEARTLSIRGGWICFILATVPGVVVGMTAYLILRSRQLSETHLNISQNERH